MAGATVLPGISSRRGSASVHAGHPGRLGAHQEVVEIKEDSDAESPENQARFHLIRELLADHRFCFRVWKKSEICAEPRLANAALILRYRAVAVTARHYKEIRRTFSLMPELPLRRFCEHSRRFRACSVSCSMGSYTSTGGSLSISTPESVVRQLGITFGRFRH